MLSSVLRSPRAVQVNIAIVRAFVKLREILATHRDLARRLSAGHHRTNHLCTSLSRRIPPINAAVFVQFVPQTWSRKMNAPRMVISTN